MRMSSMSNQIHSTAIVSPKAELGGDVEVGPYAIVEDGAMIGPRTKLLARAYVCRGAVIGSDCQIHMGAVVSHEPQHLAYQGEPTQAVLGDRVIVRENVTIHRSTGEGTQTKVGNECLLMVGSHVAHNCTLGDAVILANGAQLAGHVEVGDHAFVSGNTVIHQFVRVGRYVILSGGSRFGMDVPPYLIGDGTNTVTNLNSVGLRRSKELTNDERKEIRAAFKVLYRSDLTLPDALERMKSEFKTPAIDKWVEFFTNPSPRGFCRYKATRRENQ